MSDKPSATIHTLYKTDFKRDPVAALRTIADAIERGQYGDVGCVAIALMGDKVECFGSGPDSEGCSVAMLFHAAFLRMSKSIEEHGK